MQSSEASPALLRIPAELRAHLAQPYLPGRQREATGELVDKPDSEPRARVAFVPTMGALHAGHLALVERARESADIVVVSIFVNPLQFGAGEDFEQYPRSLDADLATLGNRADVVFAPAVSDMYPTGSPETTVSAGSVGAVLEGASRPGHFDGMLTVVLKLLNIVQPELTYFGRKDAQQAFLVRQMVHDLNFPSRIEVVPTVREAGGLALSSRNRYLDADQRQHALALYAGLREAATAADAGQGPLAALRRAREVTENGLGSAGSIDYLAIVDPASFETVGEAFHGRALALVAARLGSTRLIDNEPLVFA